MGILSRSLPSVSPVLTMSSEAPHYQSESCEPVHANQKSAPPWPVNGGSLTHSYKPIRCGGRKRSRDEASINPEADAAPPSPVINEAPESDWVYGEGMVLVKGKSIYVSDASTQSGTWIEEERTKEQMLREEHQESLAVRRSTKSQRISAPATSSTAQNTIGSHPTDPVFASSSQVGPVVDDITLRLGVGWRRVSEDAHIQAGARGWARYIERCFPISNVIVRAESKSLESYLVESEEGFYLFTEDLRQGRLVSREPEGVIKNLQRSPITFDATEVLTATHSLLAQSSDEDTTMG